MNIGLKLLFTIGLVALGLPSDSTAQASERALRMADSSAARIISDARGETLGRESNGGPQWLVRILRQSDRTVASSKIEELADSLTRIAIVGDVPGQRSQFGWAFNVLVGAGSRDRAHGRPYEGVVDRFIRISAESTDPIKSGVARSAMLSLIGGERAIPHLRELAMRADSAAILTAADAVGTLMTDALGNGWSASPRSQQLRSMAVLRELFDGRLVTSRVGQSLLEAFATSQGWRRTG
jgi:hypothetical protein